MMVLMWLSWLSLAMAPEKTPTLVLEKSLGDDSNWVFGVGTQCLEAPNGSLYLLDPKEFKVRVLDKDWKVTTTLGRRGKGPGEFEEPKTMALRPDGSLAVFDPTLKRMTIFDTKGEVVATHSLDASSVAIYHPALLHNGSLAFLSARAHNGKPVYDVSLFDKEFKLAKTLVRVNSTPMDWSQSSKPSFWVDFLKNEMQMSARGMPLVCSPDGKTIITARSDSYKLTQMDANGKVLQTIGRQVAPLPFSEPLKMAMFDEVWARLTSDSFLANNMPESVFRRAASKAEVPDALPILRAIFPFGQGFGVLINYHGLKGKGTIDLYDQKGEFSHSVAYEGPAYYLWGSTDRLYAVGPEEDVIVLKKFRLE